MSLIRERPNFAQIADELKMLGADHVLTERELLKEAKTNVGPIVFIILCYR